MKFVTQDYYQILNVAPEASGEEVKRAYSSVRKTFRPDSMAVHSLYSPEETEAISAKIEEAFQILSHPEQATSYRRYHHNGCNGMSIARNPEVFFDEVHQLDAHSSIESLALAVGDRKSTSGLEEETLDHEDAEHERGKAPELPVSSQGLQKEPTAELFLSGLQELEQPPAPTRTAPIPPRLNSASPSWTPSRLPERTGQRRSFTSSPSGNIGVTAPSLRAVSPPGMSLSSQDSTARDLSSETAANPFARPSTNPAASKRLNLEPLPAEELEAIEVDTQGINGSYLRKVREALGLDLLYIADRTKIGRSTLSFIESDQANDLPARVYLKGYLLHIARILRLPEAHTAQRYLSNLEGP